MLWPEGAKLRRKGIGLSESERKGVSGIRVPEARDVLHHSLDLAEASLFGALAQLTQQLERTLDGFSASVQALVEVGSRRIHVTFHLEELAVTCFRACVTFHD